MISYINFPALIEELLVVNPNWNLYFLIDHGGLPGLHKQLFKPSIEWVSLFDCTKESNALGAAPILISVADGGRLQMARSLLNWIGEKGTYTSTIILLSSPLKIASMKSRLGARLHAKLSENSEVMLRFFDPRIFESLENVFSDEQKKEFFSPAEEWRYVDRSGKIAIIETDFSFEENFVPPCVFNQEQESALLEASEVDQVLNLLRSNLPRSMQTLALPEQHEFVRRQINRAKQDELDSVWKMSVYAMILLLKGEGFIKDKIWPDILRKIKSGDCDFSEMFV